MKEIPLTQGYVALVDDEDFERASRYKWCVFHSKSGPRAARGTTLNGKKTSHYLSREIMGNPKHFAVDHVNGNTLDNRKSNLRLCTIQQNNWNQRIRKNNTSGHKGVTWDKSRGKWKVSIAFKGKRINIGRFADKMKAKLAYDAHARELYGEFMRSC